MSSDPESHPEREEPHEADPDSGPEPGGVSGVESGAEVSVGPSRLHPAAMIISALRSARQWAGAAAIPGVAALFSGGLRPTTLLLVMLGVAVLVVGAGAWGFLSWRATTYSVSGPAFYLRRGVLQKSERTIPLDHVQSVDTVRGVVQRIFGVVELRVETAGGGVEESDASLPALSRASAAELRRAIEGGVVEPAGDEESGPREIRRLLSRELLIAGATSGQIGVALSVVAVGSQIFDEFFTEGFVRRLYDSLAPSSVTAVLVVAIAIGVFAWLLAIAGTVLAYAGFTLSRDEEFLYIRRGLLEKREATIPLARIQAVQLVEGILRQPLGLVMLRVESAGYGGSESGVSTTLFPLLPRRAAPDFLRDAVPEFSGALTAASLKRPPPRSLRRYVFRALAPAAVLLALALTSFYASGLSLPAWSYPAALLLLALSALLGWLRHRDAGWSYAAGCVVLRSRALARTTALAPRRKLQSRSSVSNPLQRRAGLAHLRVRVASGSGGAEFGVQDLEDHDARELVSWLGPVRL
ncbi:PH domain-containing protein [Rubrobacter aplysinae]|uniref:PH domain-containing protein n=1 Tax=Rubrobacter aplysinae TaxID=909625 RepID=UPI00064B9513|nr:PH domain-containing protein [Rubrobacter aplysinae]